MSEYTWQDELTQYKQQGDTILVTGRQAYDVAVRGSQLMSMTTRALGVLDGMNGQFDGVFALFDKAGAALGSVLGFMNFAMQYLDTIVQEITSMIEAAVQSIIDEVYKQLQDLYDSAVDSVKEAIGVDTNALLAVAPLWGALFEQALSLLPADITGDIGSKLSDFRQYLDICSCFGNMKSLTNALALHQIMPQVNELMTFVNLNTWIPDAAKGALSFRFTEFQTRNYVGTDGSVNHKGLLMDKIGLSSSQADQIKDKIAQNEDAFKDLEFGMDPRCQSCIVDNSSPETAW